MSDSQIYLRRKNFHERLRKQNLLEGYSYDDKKDFVTRPYWPIEPKNKILPSLWRWKDLRSLILECGDMIGLGHGGSRYDRRVLALSNPGTPAEFTLTGPLFGDIQLIRPGEGAPCHRHTPGATRFIMEGSGGWTSVAGERVDLKPGDIVHTGQFPWHDHGNDGTDDFIFLDILDIPLLFFTGTSAWDFNYESVTGSKENVHQKVSNENHVRDPKDFAHLPWAEDRERLIRAKSELGSAYDGLVFEFTKPDGDPVGTTMSVFSQYVRPGEKTLAHRHTGSTAYICVEGAGRVIIENEVFEFQVNDILVIPSWHWHRFESECGVFLHSVNDLSLIDKMSLYREERRLLADGIQISPWTTSRKAYR